MVVFVEVDMGLTNGSKKLATIIARRCSSVPYTAETIKYLSVVLYLIASNQYKSRHTLHTKVSLELCEYKYFSVTYLGNNEILIDIANQINNLGLWFRAHRISLKNNYGNTMYLGPCGGPLGCKRDKDLYKLYRALFYDKMI